MSTINFQSTCKNKANKAFKLFKEHPYSNGLNFEKLKGFTNTYSVIINNQYRAIGEMKDGIITWTEIIPHTYNKMRQKGMFILNWSHIVVESYCSFKNDDLAEKPICCKYNAGITGLHCLAYDSQNNNYCPYLGFGTAKTTIVLTNQKGETINFDSFFGDLNGKKRRRNGLKNKMSIYQIMTMPKKMIKKEYLNVVYGKRVIQKKVNEQPNRLNNNCD